MKRPLTLRSFRNHQLKFCSIKHVEELAHLLKSNVLHLQTMSAVPVYTTFSIPKRDGSRRYIEDPYPPLKKILRHLNTYLQCVYHFYRTDAAYGFLACAVDEESPRNILTNARQHTGKSFLLNVDLEDFFHYIHLPGVEQLLSQPPFHFDEETVALLARLMTFKGRLPMGSPTSPILSNFATVAMDHELQEIAGTQLKANYTRYADDLVFSSDQPIQTDHIDGIWSVIEKHGFRINREKVKYYRAGEPREVTGLVISDTVELPRDYIPHLSMEIQKLKHIMEADRQFKTLQSGTRMREIRQTVRGHIAFAQMVLGEGHRTIDNLLSRYEEACDPPDDFISASWLEFNYV